MGDFLKIVASLISASICIASFSNNNGLLAFIMLFVVICMCYCIREEFSYDYVFRDNKKTIEVKPKRNYAFDKSSDKYNSFPAKVETKEETELRLAKQRTFINAERAWNKPKLNDEISDNRKIIYESIIKKIDELKIGSYMMYSIFDSMKMIDIDEEEKLITIYTSEPTLLINNKINAENLSKAINNKLKDWNVYITEYKCITIVKYYMENLI